MVSRMRRGLIAFAGLGGLALIAGYAWQRQLWQDQQRAAEALAHLAGLVRPRSSWGALEPVFDNFEERGRYDPLRNPGGYRVYDQPLGQILRTVVIHHSALPASAGPREIQQLHLKDKGYADIGYHFVIAADGAIYEGRPINVRGAHTGGFNTGSIGVCLTGNFEQYAPASIQLERVIELGGLLRDGYGITHLAGHRDFQPDETVCPGRYLEPRLPAIAAQLGLSFGTQGYRP